ncbi:MAG: hypothetical protein IJW92_02000 [Clostridia bacterium]|nr:hypothetical protein [Clostridia bacterium]
MVEPLEFQNHRFVVVVQNNGVLKQRFQIYCFADDVSVSDCETTLEAFRYRLFKSPLLTSFKSAFRESSDVLIALCVCWILNIFFKWLKSESFPEDFWKGLGIFLFLAFTYFGVFFVWDFASYINHRKKILELLGSSEQ